MGVRNEFGGDAYGPVVQAGVIHGDVIFRGERPEWVVPRQVPRSVPQFVDRVDVLAALDGCGIGVVSGLPGIGKSEAVRHWVEEVRERFPGGDVYVDFAALRGQVGADVSAGVSSCLRALGVQDEYLPGSLGELSAMFRTRTAKAPVLVVLDDVTDPAQVRALIPGTGSVVVATSQRLLAELLQDGAQLMPLDPLGFEHGRQLLEKLCGAARVAAEPEAARRIVEWCAGLPVALHVAAGRLATYRRLTLSGLAGELADEKRRLDALSVRGEGVVTVVFGVAYEGLPDDARRLYRLLGLYPGRRWDVELAAALAEVDVVRAQELLDVLDEASLVEYGEDERYAFHDLVRLHALRMAGREDAAGIVARAAVHVLRLAAHADLAVMGGRMRIGRAVERLERLGGVPGPFADKAAALAWLDAERGELLAVLRAAAAHEMHRVTWELAEALTALYLNHRYVGDWLASGELGVVAAAADGNPAAEARLRTLLSRPLMDLGERERAREELDAAIVCADRTDHTLLRASVREFYGRWCDRYAPARAVGVYREALALYEQAGDPRGTAIGLLFLGCAQDAAGEGEQALVTLRDACARFAAPGVEDRRMGARARAAEGNVLIHLGRTEEAAVALEDAVAALQEVGAVHYEAGHRETLYELTGVRDHLSRALEIYEAGGSPRAAVVRSVLGEDA